MEDPKISSQKDRHPKKVVLHIGTEKTATKSLQRFFCLNRSRLEKQGIWYPCSENLDYWYENGHFPLPASLFDVCPDFVPPHRHFEADVLFSEFVKDFDLRSEPTALLSAEHFSSRCSQEEIEKIGDLLGMFDVEIIVYVRPQDELLISAYSTYLRNGGQEPLDKIVREKCLVPGIAYFNYLQMMTPWWNVFGESNIKVRVFQKMRLKNGNVFDDFVRVLNISPAISFRLPEKLNKAITLQAAEFLYLANEHFPAFDDGDRAGWELGQEFRSEAISMFSDGISLHKMLHRELAQEIRDFYSRENKDLARKSRPDLNGLLFVDEQRAEMNEAHKMEGCFGREFVKWVVDQWKMARSTVQMSW